MRLRFQVSREKIEFTYSILVIAIIPILLVVNTLWLTGSVKSNFDTELRRKANLANEVFGATASDLLNQPDKLQSLVSSVVSDSSDIKELSVLIPRGEQFSIAASSNTKLRNTQVKDIQASIVRAENQPVAALVTSNNETSQRSWLVLTPIRNAKGEILAISSLSVSLKTADELISKTLNRSLIVLGFTILAILLLLVNHFRFVEYASLFAKQRELDQLKNDFMSVATHELRAPMSIIKGYIEMVIHGDAGHADAEAQKTLQVAYDQTDRLNHLVTDLLDVSRLEQGRIKYELALVDLAEVITPIIQNYQAKAKAKGLKLEYSPLAKLPQVKVDAERAGEIFSNLIDNAIKYTEKGTIEVRHEIAIQHLKTIVKDSGLGMSMEAREKLFQRFYRIRTPQTKDISGTGLGLWIIQQYAQNMGGKITVDSFEGIGSEFKVVFPIEKQ